MANTVMFFILAVVILASAVLCVTTKRIMRAATFLLFVLFGIAGLYFLLDYTYLGAAQIAVYAGGVTMIYIFAIQLVSKQTLQGMVERMKGSRVAFGALVALIGLLTTAVVFVKNHFYNNFMLTGDKEVSMKEIGNALVGADKFGYVLPFEFISIFLLACIIGGIMISRKE
jgi:NADH-quinone oxidoreductase subunit J